METDSDDLFLEKLLSDSMQHHRLLRECGDHQGRRTPDRPKLDRCADYCAAKRCRKHTLRFAAAPWGPVQRAIAVGSTQLQRATERALFGMFPRVTHGWPS